MPFSRFVIQEESMLPAFSAGDHVLTFNCGRLKRGDVVVIRLKETFFVKRIDKFVDNYVYVSGDNILKSSKLKPLKREQIIGKVILKY